jgi:hypothetical protein
MPVAALLASLAVQLLAYRGMIDLLGATLGIRSGADMWAAKTVTSLLMGAAFVAVASWVAPAAKLRAALIALGIVILWGARLMISAFGITFAPWLFAMGAAGIVGGMCAVSVTWWRLQERA